MYIVTGFVFTKTYHFVALKQNSTDIEHILTLSLVVGYIYCNIAYKIPFTITNEIDNVLIVLTALLFGYLFAILLRQKKIVLFIVDFLKIRDTGNIYLWDDLLDNKYPMKASISYGDKTYEGMIHNFESYSNNPSIVLASYVIKDDQDNIIEDFSEDNTKVIVLNTEDSKSVSLEYDHNSDECKDLLNLCEDNKRFKEQEK